MNIPLVLQGERNECGLACICMILAFHGRHVAIENMRRHSSTGARLSLDHVALQAGQQGLLTRALRCEPSDLRELKLPVIAHVDFEHYVVIAGLSRRTVTVMDPARGKVSLSLDAFSRRFTGIVLECTPAPDFQRNKAPTSSYLSRLLGRLHLSRLTRELSGLLLLTLFAQLIALLFPYYLQIVVDQVLLQSNIDLVGILTLGFLLLSVVAVLIRLLRGLLIIHLGSYLSYSLAAGLMHKTLILPLSYFARRHVGDFTSRFASLKPLQDFVSRGAVSIVLDSLMMLLTITALALLSPHIATIVILFTAALIVLQSLLLLPFQRYTHEHVMADAVVQGHFVETISAIEVIKRNQLAERRRGIWLNRLVESINPQIRAGQWELWLDIGRFLLTTWLTLIVVYFAVPEILSGSMSVGALYTLVAYAGHFATAASGVSREWQGLSMLTVHAQRLADIVETAPDDRVPLKLTESVALLELESVSLGYPDRDRLFEDLTCTIRTDSKIAITGSSGSGKSSLFRAILGEMPLASGEIRINGHPLHNRLDPSTVMTALHQGDGLLRGTIADNITLLAPVPEEARMLAAARDALIHEDILRLPMAYQEYLGEHPELSSGQQQRLLLARALYRDTGILLLDEATSHLDEDTEYAVMQNIVARPGIIIFITHRPEVAALADMVIRLPGGTVTTGAQTTRALQVQ